MRLTLFLIFVTSCLAVRPPLIYNDFNLLTTPKPISVRKFLNVFKKEPSYKISFSAACRPKEYPTFDSYNFAPTNFTGTPERCGQDAFFIDSSSNRRFFSVGVADGVGSYLKDGIDSGWMSVMLMRHSQRLFRQNLDIQRVFVEASTKTIETQFYNLGGTTACLIKFDLDKRKIYGANLGDSGVLVIRDAVIVFESQAQLVSGNPLYLSVKNAPLMLNERLQFDFDIRRGDIIIVGSDGLLNNIDKAKIVKEREDLQSMARRLANEAFMNSKNGVPNDITFVVSLIE